MNAAKRLEIFRRLHEDNPEPKTELAYNSPFELLIAGKNYLDARASERAKAAHVPVEAAPSRRVRVTGVIE